MAADLSDVVVVWHERLRHGVLRMVRGLRVEQSEVPAAVARHDNDRIAKFDNSMAWITCDPTGTGPVAKPPRPVPATCEIDWAADRVPCLASMGK